MKFKTRNTKVAWVAHVVAFFFIALLALETIDIYDENPSRGLELLLLIGMIMETLGFVILLNPKLVRMFDNREMDFTYEGILYILGGLVFQIIMIYIHG